MKRMKNAMEPSELEGATLAVIADAGECTRYRVKTVFSESPSDVWSGSAGAIYPLIERLKGRGLVRERKDKTSKRNSKLISVTPAGKKVLTAWLTDVERGAGIGFDPMRTRLSYERFYEKGKLEKYVNEVINHMNATIPSPKTESEAVLAMHEVWLRHRRLALEETLEIIMQDRKNKKLK